MRCSLDFTRDSLRLLVFHRRNIGEQSLSQPAGWSNWADEGGSIPPKECHDAFVRSKSVLLTIIVTKYVKLTLAWFTNTLQMGVERLFSFVLLAIELLLAHSRVAGKANDPRPGSENKFLSLSCVPSAAAALGDASAERSG
jgi:hypothetical protein